MTELTAELVTPGRLEVVAIGSTAQQGPQGVPGPSPFVLVGTWSSAVAYRRATATTPADAVRHAGALWQAVADSTNVTPSAAASATWMLLLQDGSAAGSGLPAAGVAGQALFKASNSDYDVAWGTVAAPDLSGYQTRSEKGAASGYASLDADSILTLAQRPVIPADGAAGEATMRRLGTEETDAAAGTHGPHYPIASSAGLASWMNLYPRINPHLVRGATATPWRSTDTAQQDLIGPVDLTTAVEFAIGCFVGIFNHTTQAFSALGTAGERAALQFCRADAGFETAWQTLTNWAYLDTGSNAAGVFLPMDAGGWKRTTAYVHASARKFVVLRIVGYAGNGVSTALVTGPLNLSAWE